MAAYNKAHDHLRADIICASNLFPDTDALSSWLLDDLPDDVLPTALEHVSVWVNRGDSKGIWMSKSLNINSFFGGDRCRSPILWTCGSGW